MTTTLLLGVTQMGRSMFPIQPLIRAVETIHPPPPHGNVPRDLGRLCPHRLRYFTHSARRLWSNPACKPFVFSTVILSSCFGD